MAITGRSVFVKKPMIATLWNGCTNAPSNAIAGFTDLLDEFQACKLDMITPLGAHLGGWGDFSIYSTMTICAWMPHHLSHTNWDALHPSLSN
ncbi:MAG: hypothetical protein GY935_15030 [Gammaproteobacteria bacterium]|nr:hypothetical protein [Gammaproteobacteria bacterium]